MKIDVIPKGKENRRSRRYLMCQARIIREKEFQQEISRLRKKHIILFDDGYYRPNTKEELQEFINSCNDKRDEMENLVNIALMEMESLWK